MNVEKIEIIPEYVEVGDKKYPYRHDVRGSVVFENVHPEFFKEWTPSQLRNECARLNQILKDCQGIIHRGTDKIIK